MKDRSNKEFSWPLFIKDLEYRSWKTKIKYEIILEGLQNCDFTCLLFIEVCGVLDHNSNI